MIVFNKLWDLMKEKNISESQFQLKKEGGIDSRTIQRLRANHSVETRTLIRLCSVLDCRMENIAEYVSDE